MMRMRNLIRRDIDKWEFLLPEYDSPIISETEWKNLCAGSYLIPFLINITKMDSD